MKKNIILLRGNDTYGIEQEVRRWKKIFADKYSSMNIESIDLATLKENPGLVKQKILSGGLFSEKQLFVLSGGNEKRDKTTDFSVFFESIFDEVPDDHFLLFHSLKERATELEKVITKKGDVKSFNAVYTPSLWKDRFEKVDIRTIEKVLHEYSIMESVLEEWEKNTSISHMIAGTLTNIELLSLTKKPTEEDIESAIGTSGGVKNFDLIDAIMNLDTKKSLSLFQRIASTKSMFEFMPSYIGLLRSALYVKYLEYHKLPIAGIKIHPYVAKKTLSSKMPYKKLVKLYTEMVRISIAYKSGKGMKDLELGRILEIELGIIGLKK